MSFVPNGLPFDAGDIGFASELADRIALSVDRARLFRDLERANRVKDEFLATLSHELRTPITSIRLLMESLRNRQLSDQDREQVVSLLARETERLEVLVGRVLELSRLQSSYEYRRETFEAAALVDEAIAAFDAVTLTRPTPIAATASAPSAAVSTA